MCGIAGIVARQRANPFAAQAMAARMAHRGPDGAGLWQSGDGRVVLSHRRLAIIDLSARGAQPMADATGSVVITFNGEIYNYRELRERLKSEGIAFRSDSDTEVLLSAYGRWDEDCLAELNGMFAFAIYDGRTRRLFCARDRFGEKPFLYATGPGYFAFASEYKALLALAEVAADADHGRICAFLRAGRRGLDDGSRTAFPAIRQLRPGECMTVDCDSLEPSFRRYWRPRPDPTMARLGEDEAVARLKALIVDSVRLRLRSDVPVGSCLSGGLDSGTVVCVARELLGGGAPYHAFSGRFPGTSADEGAWAETIAAAAQATVHESHPDPRRLLDELERFVWLNELPVASTSQYAQWCVFASAKEAGVTVLLDGQGGDEVLGGYEQYFGAYLATLRARGENARADTEAAAIRARYPLALPPAAMRLKRALPAGVRALAARLSGQGSDFLFGLSREAAAAARAVESELDEALGDSFHPLARALAEDAFVAQLPTLLRYGDRNSMAHSREVRLPFCDHRIAELALSLPPGYLMGEAETKRLLRRAAVGVLPESVRLRWNKQGFLPPQPQWFRAALAARVREMVEDAGFAASGLWNVSWWRRALARFEAGADDLAWTLWKPFIAETWRNAFVARVAAMPRLSVFAP